MHLRSSLRHSFLAATMLMLMPATAQAETGQFPLDDMTLTVEAPSQYCNVDTQYAFDNNWFEFQSRAQGDQNYLVGAFLPCAQLSQLRNAGGGDIESWVLVLATLEGPNTLAYYPDMKDAEFVTALSAEFEKGVKVDTEATSRNIDKAARDTGVSDGTHPTKVEGDGIPRPLGNSDKAVYIGLKLDVTEGGRKHTVAAAGGLSLVKGYMITLTSYGEYRGDRTMSQLLINTTSMVEQMARLNR